MNIKVCTSACGNIGVTDDITITNNLMKIADLLIKRSARKRRAA